jgi:hypothetical protein
VQIRHPLTADDTDEMSWPWLPGLVEGLVAPGEWDIVVTDDPLVEELDAGRVPAYPVCRHAAEAIRPRAAPAVALFAERAPGVRPGVRPGFTVNEDVAHVFRELEGIPLAIEPAAGTPAVADTRGVVTRPGHR